MRKNTKIKTIAILGIFGICATVVLLNNITKDDNIIIDEESTISKDLEGTISFVSNRTDKSEELNLLIEEFEELHPKVKVDLELIGNPEEILQRKATVQDLPDVTLVPASIKTSEYYKYFLKIDDLGFDGSNTYNNGLGLDDKGDMYGLMTSLNWYGIIYNKEIFKELNIDVLPTTKEEFLEICEVIKENGITPIVLNYRDSWRIKPWLEIVPYLFDEYLEDKVIKNNMDILDENSGMFKSLEFIRSIVQNGYCEEDLLNYQWNKAKTDIRDGKVAMLFLSSDFKYQLNDIGMEMEKIGMFPFPGSDSIKVFGDYKMAISKDTKHPDVAKEFLKFLFEDSRYANAVNIVSSLKDNEKSKEFFKEIEEFNLPIITNDGTLESKYYDNENIHSKYDTLRRTVGLDYPFVQRYVIEDNTKDIIDEINKKWNELEGEIVD